MKDLLEITEKDLKIMFEELKKKASEVNPMLSWHGENAYYGQVGK